MPIPDYQTLLYPIMKIVQDGELHSTQEIEREIIKSFHLSEEETTRLLPSGTQRVTMNRIGWSKTYLKMAGLIEFPKRGFLKITRSGEELIKSGISNIDRNILSQYPEFVNFLHKSKNETESGELEKGIEISEYIQTPEELIASNVKRLNDRLSSEIMESISKCTPQFFERLVVDLLLKMGYGGSFQEAGKVIGKSGDGGLDGEINEDKLGLNKVYIQAKRWQKDIGTPEIRNFVGALAGAKTKKGVFITTSRFLPSVYQYLKNTEYNIVLIDGDKLTELMIDYSLGLSVAAEYRIMKIDSDYYEEE